MEIPEEIYPEGEASADSRGLHDRASGYLQGMESAAGKGENGSVLFKCSWNRSTQAVMHSPSLEIFKSRLDILLKGNFWLS